MRTSLRARSLRTTVCSVLALPILALALLLGLTSTAQAADGDVVILAAESGGGDLPGLEPGKAADPENAFAPKEYEQNFLWGAAVGLGALTIGGFGALGGLYWLVVVRPEQQSAAQKQG
ncbi:MAG: hypothetical protein ACI867_000166 [Glaciecola sp.]|jgi:hypothetical protein